MYANHAHSFDLSPAPGRVRLAAQLGVTVARDLLEKLRNEKAPTPAERGEQAIGLLEHDAAADYVVDALDGEREAFERGQRDAYAGAPPVNPYAEELLVQHNAWFDGYGSRLDLVG